MRLVRIRDGRVGLLGQPGGGQGGVVWWRSEQLELLDGAVEAAASGHPMLLSIEGEPGQGKTSLLREVAERAVGFQRLLAEGVEELIVSHTRRSDSGRWNTGSDRRQLHSRQLRSRAR